MVASDNVFAGSIPALYQRLMVPMLFEGYADDLAERVAALGPRDVLEAAAGTGAVSAAAGGEVLPPEARLIVTDLNPATLALARDAQGATTGGSRGSRPMRWRCPSTLRRSTWCFVSLGDVLSKASARCAGWGRRFLFSARDGLATNDFARAVNCGGSRGASPHDRPLFLRADSRSTALSRPRRDRSLRRLSGPGLVMLRNRRAVDRVSRLGSARGWPPPIARERPCAPRSRRGGDLEEVTQIVTAALEERFGTGAVEGAIRAFVITATSLSVRGFSWAVLCGNLAPRRSAPHLPVKTGGGVPLRAFRSRCWKRRCR